MERVRVAIDTGKPPPRLRPRANRRSPDSTAAGSPIQRAGEFEDRPPTGIEQGFNAAHGRDPMEEYLASSSNRMVKGLEALQGASPEDEEQAQAYREQILRQIRLNAIGVMSAHKTSVKARRSDMYENQDPSAGMSPLRDAAYNIGELDRTKEKLEGFERNLRLIEGRALMRRGDLSENLDELALNSNKISTAEERQGLIDRFLETKSRGSVDDMWWFIYGSAGYMQNKRRSQIDGVDASLSVLYDKFPALSQLSPSDVAGIDSDAGLKARAEKAFGRVLLAIDDTIRGIHNDDIGAFDMPAIVALTRDELPAPLKPVLEEMKKEHQTSEFWKDMGLTAAEILLAFVPVVGPALAMGIGVANLAVQGEELLDQMQMAEAGANPIENPLGDVGPSSFDQAMFAVTAILSAVGAGGVALQLRGGKAAASAIDEAADALTRQSDELLGKEATTAGGVADDAAAKAPGTGILDDAAAKASGAAPEASEVVIYWDKPLSTSGFSSSGAGNPEGSRVNVYEGRIPGVSEPVAIKVYEPGRYDVFERDIAGAAAASKTERAAKFYGEVPAGEGKKAFAMEKVKGGMTDNGSDATPGSPEWIAAENEASFYRDRVSIQTLDDLEDYGEQLLATGHYYSGELQGLVTAEGRWVAIDFQGVSKLPSKADKEAFRKAMEWHKSAFSLEKKTIRGILNDKAGK